MSSADQDRLKLLEDKICCLEKLLEGKKELNQQELPFPPDGFNQKEIPMAKTRVLMHEIILASQTDEYGICFGGQVKLQSSTGTLFVERTLTPPPICLSYQLNLGVQYRD